MSIKVKAAEGNTFWNTEIFFHIKIVNFYLYTSNLTCFKRKNINGRRKKRSTMKSPSKVPHEVFFTHQMTTDWEYFSVMSTREMNDLLHHWLVWKFPWLFRKVDGTLSICKLTIPFSYQSTSRNSATEDSHINVQRYIRKNAHWNCSKEWNQGKTEIAINR